MPEDTVPTILEARGFLLMDMLFGADAMPALGWDRGFGRGLRLPLITRERMRDASSSLLLRAHFDY